MGRRAKNVEEVEEEEDILQPEEIASEYFKENKDDHLNDREQINYKIPTGSLKWDIETSGGLGSGFHRFCGHNNAGKTPAALQVQANFLAFHGKAKRRARGILIRAEGRFSEENAARTGVIYVYDPKEWRDGTVLVFNCQKYETIAGLVDRLLHPNEAGILYCLIIDSMDGLKLKVDEGKTLDQNEKVAGAPKMTKRFLTDYSLEFNVLGHMGILISQVSANIVLDKYNPGPRKDGNFSGGNGIAHYSNWAFEFQKPNKSDYILDNPNGKLNDDKSKVLGHLCRMTVVKSTNETNYINIEFPVKHGITNGCAVWTEREIADELVAMEYISTKGAWMEVDETFIKEVADKGVEMPAKINGMNKLYTLLNENKTLAEHCLAKIRAIRIDAKIATED